MSPGKIKFPLRRALSNRVRKSIEKPFSGLENWRGAESNRRREAYESSALPTELPRPESILTKSEPGWIRTPSPHNPRLLRFRFAISVRLRSVIRRLIGCRRSRKVAAPLIRVRRLLVRIHPIVEPGWIRTIDTCLKRAVLYQTELRALRRLKLEASASVPEPLGSGLDGVDFRFFVLERFVDFGDELVGYFLDLFLGAVRHVFGDRF